MPVLNEAEALFLGDVPVSSVFYGESIVWPSPPRLTSIVPPTSVSPPTTCSVQVYGSGFNAGCDVCWVVSTTPNNTPFSSAVSFVDSTHMGTTLHHLNPNVDYLVWVRRNSDGMVSERVLFYVSPVPVVLAIESINPTSGPPESQVLDIYGTGFLPVYTGSSPYSVVMASAFGDFFQIGDTLIFIDSTHLQVPDFWPAEGDYEIYIANHDANGTLLEQSNLVPFVCESSQSGSLMLTSLDPSSGTGSAVDLHLYGTGFEYTATPVVFFRHSSGNNYTAYAEYIDSTHLYCPGFVSTIDTELWVRNPAPTYEESNKLPFTVALGKEEE